jgi:UDP-glucuronate 4-epimerase
MIRDFTYIDDIVEGVVRVLDHVPGPDPAWPRENHDPATSHAPYRIFNIGNNRPVPLLDCIAALERALGRTATLNMLPMQPGDVVSTMADITDLEKAVGFRPNTPIETGIARFVEWYRQFYGVDES